MKSKDLAQNSQLQHTIAQLAAVMHYESSRFWQTIKGENGEIISLLWPSEINYPDASVTVREEYQIIERDYLVRFRP